MSKKYYKGFNKNMTCRGFQFKEGETYEEKEAKLCEKGFHACENPLGCWSYYDMLDSVFHEVKLDGVSDERNADDTKVCAKKIKIGARLDMKGIVKASVDFVMESVKGCFDKKPAALATTRRSAALATPRRSISPANAALAPALDITEGSKRKKVAGSS